jgi:protein-L-isoaspartate(D-aspartate) O-methyltransferase
VLDVGTGSGYHAAVLARLAGHVWSIERHGRLSRRAARNLAAAGVENVTLVVGDGTRGLPPNAPFDAINVAAAGNLETLAELEAQLAPGGRLVAPITEPQQRLSLTRRTPTGLERELLEEVRFVPLVRDE